MEYLWRCSIQSQLGVIQSNISKWPKWPVTQKHLGVERNCLGFGTSGYWWNIYGINFTLLYSRSFWNHSVHLFQNVCISKWLPIEQNTLKFRTVQGQLHIYAAHLPLFFTTWVWTHSVQLAKIASQNWGNFGPYQLGDTRTTYKGYLWPCRFLRLFVVF